MPLPLTVSCFSKIQIGFTFWCRPTRVVPERGLLNGVCACVCVCVCQSHIWLIWFDHGFAAGPHWAPSPPPSTARVRVSRRRYLLCTLTAILRSSYRPSASTSARQVYSPSSAVVMLLILSPPVSFWYRLPAATDTIDLYLLFTNKAA